MQQNIERSILSYRTENSYKVFKSLSHDNYLTDSKSNSTSKIRALQRSVYIQNIAVTLRRTILGSLIAYINITNAKMKKFS